MDQPHRTRQFDLVGLDDDHLALDAAKFWLGVARGKATAIDHDAVEFGRAGLAVEFYGAASRGKTRVQFRQHAARLDMAFAGIEQALAKTAFQRRFEFGHSLCVEPPMARCQPGKAFEIAAVAWMRHHQRTVEWRLRKMLAPQIERADAEPADHGLRCLGLAPGRQHAAGPGTGRLRHRGIAALMQRDRVAGPRKQQRLPRAGNACADDGNGGFPPPRLWPLIHPCPFAGMTRIRFKGSPRSRYLRTGFERAVSQLLIGAPLGTALM